MIFEWVGEVEGKECIEIACNFYIELKKVCLNKNITKRKCNGVEINNLLKLDLSDCDSRVIR